MRAIIRYLFISIRITKFQWSSSGKCQHRYKELQGKENDLSESQRFYIGPHDIDDREYECQAAERGGFPSSVVRVSR